MLIPEQFLPKLNARRVSIPLLSPLDEQEFSNHFARETPFLIEADLSSLLLSTLSQIQKVPKEQKIKTFDSIPYREIREGLFHKYMDYVEHAPSNCLFPEGFDVVEERLESVTETKFRHYALSLNESLFPEIEGFRIPGIEERNYLLNLKSNFFQTHGITSPHWLFIHPAFSVSNAHYDHDSVHTAIAQLKGRKKAYLISPEHHATVQQEQFPRLPNGFNDFSNPLIAQLPCGDMELWAGDLRENQVLFIPRRWIHYVVSETPGMSYSQDIVNSSNLSDWLGSLFKTRI